MPRILFMGTPIYAVPFLEGLIQAGHILTAVFTQPDRPVGRGHTLQAPPVKVLAEKHGIPVFQPEKIRDDVWVEKIRELSPDCIIVVAFGQIIPQSILDIPQSGCINVHPSLLPRHRGASPLQETILSGDAESAVSIMRMDAQMDHGPILSQERFPVATHETYESLCEKTTHIGVPLLLSTIRNWLDNTITLQEQDHTKATFTRLLNRDMGKIDWSESATEIDRKVRALNPWPGTWCEWRGKRIKILKAAPQNNISCSITDTGVFHYSSEDCIRICCGASDHLAVSLLQVEGKKPMTAKEFNHGYLRETSI